MRTAELGSDTAGPSHRAVGAIVASTILRREHGTRSLLLAEARRVFLICQGEEQFNLAKTADTNRDVCACRGEARSVLTQAICFF